MSAAAPAVPLHLELDDQQARAVAALLRCLGRYGLAKTNLDDVARDRTVQATEHARLLAHEPETVYGHLAFAEGDALMLRIADAIAPAFTRWLSADDSYRAADWLTRVVRAYCLTPRPVLDLADEAVARPFLRQFVIPGIAGSPESRKS